MRKIDVIFFIFIICLAVPFIKFFDLNQDRDRFVLAGKFRAEAVDLNTFPRKGIIDRNGNELAVDILRSTLIFENSIDKDNALAFASIEGEPVFLTNPRRIYFEKQLSKNFISRLEKFCQCEAIYESLFRRYYPYGGIISPLIGFSGLDGGLEGLEKSYENYLKSDFTKRNLTKDRKGRRTNGDLAQFLSESNSPPLKLTIDINLQLKLFEELRNSIATAKAKGGFGIIMDIKKGDILASASYPTYNPNDSDRVAQRNRVIEEFIEPGSLIKPLTVAGALEQKIINHETLIDTNPGYINLSSYRKGEAGGKNFGVISLSEVISKSSQVGIAKIAIQFETEQLRSNLMSFGISKDLNLNWPSINFGHILDRQKFYDIDKASIGYGYLVNTNLVQIARAYSVFGNNGLMVEPRLMMSEATQSVRVVNEENANFILDALRETVLNGTAENLRNAKVSIAGKTGTAEKFVINEGYVEGKYVSSFAGIFPYEDPQYVMVISIDEPDPNNYYGGQVSAPIVGNLSEFMLSNDYEGGKN